MHLLAQVASISSNEVPEWPVVPPIPLELRFWPKVDRKGPDECWPWLGSKHGKGYGGISVNGRSVPAHRVAFSLTSGPPSDDLFVLHRCDNPICVNPAHLFLGTHQDNMDDMVSKGRTVGVNVVGRKRKTSTDSNEEVIRKY